MKRLSIPLFSLPVLMLFVAFRAGAQSAETVTSPRSETPQEVLNRAVTNPNVLIVTGKIIDAATGKPVSNARINLEKFGDELINASVDNQGNYALALNKDELGEPIRIVFKIDGYKRYVVKNIDKTVRYVDADIYLQPAESAERSTAKVRFELNPDPFNPLVIKLQ
ncbi:MAG: hypothetical protein NZM35_04710 [Chitinophagales bacterium]|nr:hypothetical protein [Chitinophagales bacterium]